MQTSTLPHLRRHILLAFTLLSMAKAGAVGASPPTYDHSKSCIAQAELLKEAVSTSKFSEIPALFYDVSEGEAARLEIWTKIAIRELGYPGSWSLVAASTSPEVTKEFAGLSFTTLSLDQWREAESVSKLLYRVFFSHEREGVVSLDMIRDGGRCEIAMMAVGLPAARADTSKRIPEIASFMATEVGDGQIAH